MLCTAIKQVFDGTTADCVVVLSNGRKIYKRYYMIDFLQEDWKAQLLYDVAVNNDSIINFNTRIDMYKVRDGRAIG